MQLLLLFVFVVAHWQAAIRAAVAAGATGTGTGPTGSGVNNGCRWFGSYDRLSEAMAPDSGLPMTCQWINWGRSGHDVTASIQVVTGSIVTGSRD